MIFHGSDHGTFVEITFIEVFVEASSEFIFMEASMKAFDEFPKASVKVTATEASVEALHKTCVHEISHGLFRGSVRGIYFH